MLFRQLSENSQLNQALKSLTLKDLSLVECCYHSGNIDKDSVEIIILSTTKFDDRVQLKIGVFFREVLTGCACSDNPFQTISYENGYCEQQLIFNNASNLLETVSSSV